MEMNSRMRWFLRIQNLIYVALVLALLSGVAWLGERYSIEFDWTANQRNSLTDESVALLEGLPAPVEITAYVSEDEVLRTAIATLVGRYQRVRPDITLQFVNPDLSPEQAREAGVRFDGTLVIHHQGRREQVSNVSEAAISEAIARLSRERETFAVFTSGHGERSPEGRANFDLALLGAQLKQQGFRVQALNLATNPLPENTGILVIAGPRTEWLPAELEAVRAYVDKGGNVLWLTDPEGVAPLPDLAKMLQVEVLPGMIVDATTQLMGVSDPTVAIVAQYPSRGPIENFELLTLYPRAAAVTATGGEEWTVIPILRTTINSWRETGPIAGNVKLDEGDESGPVTLGLAMERTVGERTQRIVVVGDGDFASNAFVGNQGNMDLAMNLFNWLGQQDALLNIRIKEAPDVVFSLTRGAQIAIGAGFLLVLPLLLLGMGVLVFFRRRRR